jgi:hypothetical protein
MSDGHIANFSNYIEHNLKCEPDKACIEFDESMLNGSSANCKRLCITNNDGTKHSIKFQVNLRADNLLIDDLNGLILQRLQIIMWDTSFCC